MNFYYILDEHGEPQPMTDVLAWGLWFDRASRDRSRIIQQDYVEGTADDQRVGVSTVFLGLDHNFTATGPPVLWESLVFGTALNGQQRRYTSKAAAIRGHQDLVARVSEAWQREAAIPVRRRARPARARTMHPERKKHDF
jgi:hypothetical protein